MSRRALTGLAAAALLAAAPALHAATPPETPLAGDYVTLGDRVADDWAPAPRTVRPIATAAGGPAAAFPLRGPTGVWAVTAGAVVVAESMTGRVLRLGRDGRVSVLRDRRADDYAGCAPIELPEGSDIRVDRLHNRVLRYDHHGEHTPFAGTGRTGFAGDGGPAVAARLNAPSCVARAADGSVLVVDAGNRRVRRVAPDGTITTVAGDGSAGPPAEGVPATATGMSPQALAPLPDGTVLVTDPAARRVLRIGADGILTTFAGTGRAGTDGDGGPAARARLVMPWGIAREQDGSVVVADLGGQTVRRIRPDGTITTVLGAPPQTGDAAPSRAGSATVPGRRRVVHWVRPDDGASFGDTGTSDEAASGSRALVRVRGYAGGLVAVRVVRGDDTAVWWNENPSDACWAHDRTSPGDPVQARDLQSALGARAPYAPGPGPFAPDLVRGRHVLTRTLVWTDRTPRFGIPAWVTDEGARRLVEHLVDRRTGRVVAMQVWAPGTYQRRYRITAVAAGAPLRLPATAPRRGARRISPEITALSCGGRPLGEFAPPVGFPQGIALGRRLVAHLRTVPGLSVEVRGRAPVGRPFSARSRVALRDGRVYAGVTRVRVAGRPEPDATPPTGPHVTIARGDLRWYRLPGSACWIGAPPPAGGDVGTGSSPVPLNGAFVEQPVRRGRLVLLRLHTSALRIDVLADPRTMRVVSQRWRGSGGHTGEMRFAELASAPRIAPPRRLCATG